ncbi:MAG: hypothetical protein QOH66_1946, partial [Actinomycetota bacterium]|nr:hypothetical protein [Actinomycetota bacterium]
MSAQAAAEGGAPAVPAAGVGVRPAALGPGAIGPPELQPVATTKRATTIPAGRSGSL